VQLEGAALRQRQCPQVVNEPRQHLGFFQQRRQVVGVGRIDPIEQRLEVALEHGDGRAQLVGHVCQQAAALIFAAPQAAEHGVEGACQGAQLARPALAHARGQVAGFDALGRVDQVAQGKGEKPQRGEQGEEEDERQRQGDPQCRGGCLGAREDTDQPQRCSAGGGDKDPEEEEERPCAPKKAAPRAAPAADVLRRRGPGFVRRPPGRPVVGARLPAAPVPAFHASLNL
jgi:hypothetical protein